jgi:hypothetical protein
MSVVQSSNLGLSLSSVSTNDSTAEVIMIAEIGAADDVTIVTNDFSALQGLVTLAQSFATKCHTYPSIF